MKKNATYSLLLFLAFLIFYGGGGVNLITYCCNDCHSEGVEAVVKGKCCEIHNHTHLSVSIVDEPICCMQGSKGCDVQRVEFDWTNISFQSLDLQPNVIDLFYSVIPDLLLGSVNYTVSFFSICSTGPPIPCPRVYLSLLTMLLI